MNLSKIVNKIKDEYSIYPSLADNNVFEVKFENFTIFANKLDQIKEHSYFISDYRYKFAGISSGCGDVTICAAVTSEFLDAFRQHQLIGKKENVIVPSKNLVLLGSFIKEIKYSNYNSDHSLSYVTITLFVDNFAYIQ